MGGKNGKTRKKSEGDKPHKLQFIIDPFVKMCESVTKAAYNETHTGPGLTNLLFDIVLLLIILITVLSRSSIFPFIRALIAVFCPNALPHIDNTSVIPELLILAGLFFACLIFMTVVERIWDKRDTK